MKQEKSKRTHAGGSKAAQWTPEKVARISELIKNLNPQEFPESLKLISTGCKIAEFKTAAETALGGE